MKKLLALCLAVIMVMLTCLACDTTQPGNTTPQGSVDPGPVDPGATTTVADVPETPKPYGTLHDYTTTEITTLNPFTNGDTSATSLLNCMSLRLYIKVPNVTGDGYDWLPELAAGEPVSMNEEGTLWEIPIRQGLIWEDGTAITAHDIVYSAKMCMDPLLLNRRAGTYASNYVTIKNATEYYLQASEGNAPVDWETVGIRAKDDFTLTLELESFATPGDIKDHFNTKWSNIVHKATFEACFNADRTQNTYGTSKDTIMSCGRFLLTDFQPSQYFAYKRNENYPHGDLVKVEGWDCTVVADANTAMQLFLAGELDMVTLSSSTKEQYEEDPRVHESFSDNVSCMIINIGNTNQNGIFQNLNFRKALFYGIDRVSVAKIVKGQPANWIVSNKCVSDPDTGIPFRSLDSSKAYLGENFSYDPDLAKSYYQKALTECGLTEVTVELLYSEKSANNKAISELLASSLPALFGDSFHVTLNAQSSSVAKSMRKAWATSDDPNTYELTFTTWGTGILPWNALKVYTGWYDGKNEPFFNDEFDEMYEITNNSRKAKEDPAYRIEVTQKMEQMLLDNVVTIPMYENPDLQLYSDRVVLPVTQHVQGLDWGFLFASIVE